MNLINGSKRVTRGLFTLSALTLIAPLTWAQSDDESEKTYFDEIIVTAEKTEKSVMDTAMTITGFSSDMLKQLNIQDRDKLQIMVPGLQFGETVDQQGNGTSLRGIGTRAAGIEHHDLSVATYVDGAYTIGLYGVAPGGGFDLERVEVARGPQGTLNGRNAIAGSINYVFKKPTQEWDMEVMAQVDDVSQTRLNAAVGGPIMNNLSFRLNGGVHTGDGYQENVGTGLDMGAPDQEFYAAQLRFQTEKFDSNIRFSNVTDQGIPASQVQLANFNTTDAQVAAPLIGGYTQQNAPPDLFLEDNPYYLYATQNPSGPSDCPVGTPYMRCGDIENKVAHNRNGFNDSEADMLNFYMQYDFTDNVSLRYTYADSDVAQYTFRDGDYTTREAGADRSLASDGGVPYLDRTYEVTYDYVEDSHELLLTWDVSDKLDLIVGAFTYDSEVDFKLTRFQFSHDWRFINPDESAQDWDGVFGVPVNNCQDFLNNVVGPVFGEPVAPSGTDSFWFCPNQFGEFGRTHGDLTAIVPFGTGTSNSTKAVFANADYEINENWRISGGLRYLEDEKNQPKDRFGGSFMLNFAGVPLVIGFFEGGLDNPGKWKSTVGQLTLEYRTDNDSMIYGRISTGHKPGVFNFSSPPIPGVPESVEESTLINYETGVKGTYLDGRFQLAASAFYMDYDKMHLTAAQALPSGFSQNLGPEQSPLGEYIAGIPNSKVYGLEVEYSYAFNDSTSLVGYYAYTDSEVGEHASMVPGDPDALFDFYDYPDLENPGEMLTGFYQLPTDQTGNQLPAQPNNKLAATLIHDMPFSNGASLSLLGTYSYTGSMYSTIANIDLYEIPACNRVDVSAQYSSSDSRWSAMLYANNVVDEICVSEFNAGNGFGGQAFLGSVTNHRVIGLTFRWNAF